MEKFMLIFQSEITGKKPSPQEMQEIMGKWNSWIQKLVKDGKYVSGEPLLPGGKIIKGTAKTVTDGPFTEGKEIIGGYFIINAADFDEAVALCDGYPDYERGGTVIVRQVQKMDMPS